MNLPLVELEEVSTIAGAAFERLRSARLFITGGTGFFGKWLLETLVHANDSSQLDLHATVLTRDPQRFRVECPHLIAHASLSLVQGDIRTFDFPEGRFTHVIHAATSSSTGPHETPLETIATIVDGTRRVVEFARRASAERLLFTSSGAVYGPQPTDVDNVDEDYPGAPDCMDLRTSYGHAKRLAEQICAQAHAAGGPEPIIARAFAFVGPHLPLDAHFAIGNFLGDALRGRTIRVSGDGTPHRSYLYAADLAIWLWTLLTAGTPNRPYNVGSDCAVSIGDLATQIGRRFGVPVEILGQPLTGAAPQRYVPSTARARNELGLQPRIELPEAIDRTAQWHRTTAWSQR